MQLLIPRRKGNMLHKNISISITRSKFCSLRTTLFFLKVHVDCERFPVNGKRQMSSPSSWRAGRSIGELQVVSVTLVSRKIMKDSQDDQRFSWKTFPDVSEVRRWLEATSKDSARANYASPIWLNFVMKMIGSVDEEEALDVICLDLNRAFVVVSCSCGIHLGKWERDVLVG